MIDNVCGMVKAIVDNSHFQFSQSDGKEVIKHQFMSHCFTEELFCPLCGARRKYSVERFSQHQGFDVIEPENRAEFDELPIIHIAKCLQCEKKAILVLYEGPEQLELAVLRDTYGGCVTENTPKEVKYYIDQAYRARMVSALSASMAMYRSALEWILYEQGYTQGMLGAKIQSLEEEIKNNQAPEWAKSMPVELLLAIKNVGNGAMHTNNGEISKQQEIDKGLIELVDIIFAELLDVIYEQPIRRSGNLEKLKRVADKLRK